MGETRLADILGPEGAAASPGTIRRVAVQFEDISTTCGTIRSSLAALDGSGWTGQAADLYREKANSDLPDELSKVSRSFGEASGALGTYAGQLNAILDQGNALARQRDAAVENLQSTTQRERSASANLRSARSARDGVVDPAARAHSSSVVASAERAFRNASSARQSAADALARIDRRAEELRNTLHNDATLCAARLQTASDDGIRNTLFSFGDRHIVHGVPGEVIGELGTLATGAAATIGKFVEQTAGLAAAVMEVADNPWDQSRWDHLADSYSHWVDSAKPIVEAVAITAAVAGIALLVFASDGTALAFAPELLTIAGWSNKAGDALDATKGAADAYLYTRGKRTSQDLADDGVDLVGDLASGRLDSHPEKGIENLRSSLDTLSRTGTPQAKGWVTRRVVALKAPELKNLVVHGGSELIKAGVHAAMHNVNVLMGHPARPAHAPDVPVHPPNATIARGADARVRVHVAPSAVRTPVAA
jgi:hypothetical protein